MIPSTTPSCAPTNMPTDGPSKSPSAAPSPEPTMNPTPSGAPTMYDRSSMSKKKTMYSGESDDYSKKHKNSSASVRCMKSMKSAKSAKSAKKSAKSSSRDVDINDRTAGVEGSSSSGASVMLGGSVYSPAIVTAVLGAALLVVP
uniref:Uncharacterized protein n=1 Tax=Leptocylindrus danicus TaxID=163516 RepID=A0A7S2JTP5_9STRA|mmetsp:Transcript_11499/g.17404  ORF Transcript_11499/g.17404 Transcript_11499/m.17404 type:complete len:144 (+) Transcript_11499:221-652(+)